MSPAKTPNGAVEVIVPTEPDGAKTIVPIVELPSMRIYVIELVAAVIRVHLLVAVIPLNEPAPFTGIVPAMVVLNKFTNAEEP